MLTTWLPLSTKVGTNFADKRRSLGSVKFARGLRTRSYPLRCPRVHLLLLDAKHSGRPASRRDRWSILFKIIQENKSWTFFRSNPCFQHCRITMWLTVPLASGHMNELSDIPIHFEEDIYNGDKVTQHKYTYTEQHNLCYLYNIITTHLMMA
jgi:hypothetical protein